MATNDYFLESLCVCAVFRTALSVIYFNNLIIFKCGKKCRVCIYFMKVNSTACIIVSGL